MNITDEYNTSELEENICNDCDHNPANCNNITNASGENVCSKYGYVLGPTLSNECQRAYNQEERKKKIHNEPTNQLGTRLVSSNTDYSGKKITSNCKWKRKYWISRYNKRNLTKIIGENEIKRLMLTIGNSNTVKNMAIEIYNRCVDEKIIVGRSIEEMALASTLIAFKKNQSPIGLDDLIEDNSIKTKINKYMRSIILDILPKLGISLESLNPGTYIPFFCSKLKLPYVIETNAIKMANILSKIGKYNGKSQKGIEGAILYFITNLPRYKSDYQLTQREVANVANVTEVTIRNRINEFKKIIKKQTINNN